MLENLLFSAGRGGLDETGGCDVVLLCGCRVAASVLSPSGDTVRFGRRRHLMVSSRYPGEGYERRRAAETTGITNAMEVGSRQQVGKDRIGSGCLVWEEEESRKGLW